MPSEAGIETWYALCWPFQAHIRDDIGKFLRFHFPNQFSRPKVPFLFVLLNSPRNRDDLTVEVIFFGEGDNSGDVVRNPDASASNLGLKAKLWLNEGFSRRMIPLCNFLYVSPLNTTENVSGRLKQSIPHPCTFGKGQVLQVVWFQRRVKHQ